MKKLLRLMLKNFMTQVKTDGELMKLLSHLFWQEDLGFNFVQLFLHMKKLLVTLLKKLLNLNAREI